MKFTRFWWRIVLVVILIGGGCNAVVSVWNLEGNLVGTYTNIQTAIDACPVGGTVLVAAGTYTEQICINKSINLIADGKVVISWGEIFEGGSLVVFDGDSADGAIISGFIITGSQEAAVECRNGADPKIINNTMSHNWDGILADTAAPIIANNIILYNESDGIVCWESSAVIINNTIVNNDLGGIYLWNSSATILNNIIVGNGGKSAYSCGIYSYNSSPNVDYNCVWGNGIDTTGDSIGDNNYNGCTIGSHDISQNPQFVNSEDFYLQYSSPCIDKGTNTAFMNLGIPMVDRDGNERIVNNIIDIGAYEFQLQKAVLFPRWFSVGN